MAQSSQDEKTGAAAGEESAAAETVTTEISTEDFLEQTRKIEELVGGGGGVEGDKKGEMGAATLARMAGLATATELKIIEGKLDLVTGRLANLGIRIERVLNVMNNMPTGSDMERLETVLANMRVAINEVRDGVGGQPEAGESSVTKDKLDAFLKRSSEPKESETVSAAEEAAGDGGAGDDSAGDEAGEEEPQPTEEAGDDT